MIAWLRKYWFLFPLVVGLLGGFWAYAQRDANIDTLLAEHDEDIDTLQEDVDCIKDDMGYLKEQAAIQREFYKLLKPDLWEEAEEKVNNDSL